MKQDGTILCAEGLTKVYDQGRIRAGTGPPGRIPSAQDAVVPVAMTEVVVWMT